MASPRRRVSYVIPPPTESLPLLELPPHGLYRHGSTSPSLVRSRASPSKNVEETPKWARHPRHRLGVASLAIDASTQLAGRGTPEGILYTGGRDGLVMSWDLEVPMKKRAVEKQGSSSDALRRTVGRWELMTGWADNVIDEEAEDADAFVSDGDILGDVSSPRRRKRPSLAADALPLEQQWEANAEAFKPGQASQFRQCAQMHMDWVNDLLLCNYNQTVVSASSDGTIKTWNPHSNSPLDPSVIGTHTDYVRCLTKCREQNWIASGSFDRTIKLWDLSRAGAEAPDPLITLNPPDATAPKSSVYAIAADPFGSTIASGSPERVVRLWDPRSGKRTGKLVGHTDNIRSILLSEDAKYLLTGSADATVKLWSLATQRCLHTFTHHTDSVWSLFSTHPSLEVFYSGDKSGLVCKVDVEDCSDIGEGECIVLCQDTGERSMASSEGINKIVAMDDALLWTASGSSSVKRWRVPPRRATRASAFVADMDVERERERNEQSDSLSVSRSRRRQSNSADTTRTLPHSSSPPRNGVVHDNWKPHRDREDTSTLYGIPFESLVRLPSPNDTFMPFSSRGRDPEVATLYSAASVMSIPRAPVRSPVQAIFQQSVRMPSGSPKRGDGPSRAGGEETVAPVNAARADYEDRELASEAIPLYDSPDETIHGEHGLVRSIILNDRIHALTVNTAGEVAVWDIVRGICLGTFPREDVASASHHGSSGSGGGDRERSPREALEAVRERIESEAVVVPWSSVDTKTGVLTVHVSEKCFEAEIYADEAGYVGHDRHMGEEVRLNIGKWVLRNLFLGFIRELQRTRRRRESFNRDDGRFHPGNNSSHIERNGSTRHKRSSSNSSQKTDHSPPASTAIVSSPKMIPAVSPIVTSLPRTSPLLTPMIPLHSTMTDTALPLPSIPQSPLSIVNTNDATPMPRRSATIDEGRASATPISRKASKEADYFSMPTRRPSTSTIPSTPDDFSGWGGPGRSAGDSTASSTPSTSGLMGRLKNFGKTSKKTPGETTTHTVASPSAPGSPVEHEAQPGTTTTRTPLQMLLSGPISPPTSAEAPTLSLLPNISILISEEASPGWKTLYRGTVASTHADLSALEKSMPVWLLEYLFLNKVQPVPVSKLSFVLLPWNKDPGEETLPELLNTAQSKLTASRFLRVRKLTVHVQDKLDKIMRGNPKVDSPRSSVDIKPSSSSTSISSSRSSRPRADDLYEILCNDVVLPLDMTLAAVRQFIWRQASELTMHYRLKGSTSPRHQEVPPIPSVP